MKDFKISTLHIFCFFILYLSFPNVYKCIQIRKSKNNGNNNDIRFKANNGNMFSQWINKGQNFIDLLKNGYVKNKENLDEVKEELANELANKIQNKIEDYLKEEKDIDDDESFTDEDLNNLKIYVKDISEYVGSKASEILDKNLEEALKPILTKKAYDKFERDINNENIYNLEFEKEKPDEENANEETETLVNDLVEEYETNQLDTLDQSEKEIKAHDNFE